jgi:hypothetical protein
MAIAPPLIAGAVFLAAVVHGIEYFRSVQSPIAPWLEVRHDFMVSAEGLEPSTP